MTYKEIADSTYDFCDIPIPKTKEEYLINEERFMIVLAGILYLFFA